MLWVRVLHGWSLRLRVDYRPRLDLRLGYLAFQQALHFLFLLRAEWHRLSPG